MKAVNKFVSSVCILMWLVLDACVAQTPLNEEIKLKVGVPSDLPGYAVMADGTLKVSSPLRQRITDCVEKGMNAKITWIGAPTLRILSQLSSAELDMVYPLGFTSERGANLLPSKPTWESGDVLVSLQPISLNNRNLSFTARLGSPQHTEYLADFSTFIPSYSYGNLPKLLERKVVDVAILNRNTYQDMKPLWPHGHITTAGKSRYTGFYLNKADPRHLLEPLNTSIARCLKSTGP